MLIAISGNMGVGKSTLVQYLEKELGWKAAMEPVDQNPYLQKAYEDRAKWNFKLQMYYLEKRLKIHREYQNRKEIYLLDRSVYEGAEIFLPVQLEFGMVTKDEFDEYQRIYSEAKDQLEVPRLMVGLKIPYEMLLSQIKKRGRDYELKADQKYFERLHEVYDEWFENYARGPKIIVDYRSLDLNAVKLRILDSI